MTHGFRRGLNLSVIPLVLLAALVALAQVPSNSFTLQKTPWGDPDLQGTFNAGTVTPFERPAELSGKDFLNEQEAAALEARVTARRVDAPPRAGDPGTYNQFWFEPGTKVVSTRRTSLVIDPADGHIPPLTEAGLNAQKARAARAESGTTTEFDNPENRPLTERCLWWASTGPPILPTGYNNNYRVAQSPGYVMLVAEMIHDARIIPLNKRPHLPSSMRQWLGDSRGHWEGNTLVVETTNFNDETKVDFGGRPPFGSIRGIGQNARLIERFTRVAQDILMYEFTIDDLVTYTRPWTVQMSWRKADSPVFEYACHEANYGMENILRGARQAEGKTPR